MTQHEKDPHSQKPEKKQIPSPDLGKGGHPDVRFLCLEPGHLGSVPVIVQALDNQWISRTLLAQTMKKGNLTTSVEKKRSEQIRAEYIRSLINGKQIVINRAFLYNSHEIARDYTKGNPQREAVKTLLNEGTLIPYLLGEKAPDYDPDSALVAPGSKQKAANYEVVDAALTNWKQLCREVQMQCVRLSWDDKENWRQAQVNLSQRFNGFAASILAKDIDIYIRDLRLDPSVHSSFRQRLGEMANLCVELQSRGKLATRNDLYKAFVTAGDNPALRQYDPDKPFSGEIKQLLDLAYNSNLPDALGGYLLTPADSLPRTSLQEWQKADRELKVVTGEDLVVLLRQTSFALANEVLQGVKGMENLTLDDVIYIRNQTEAWSVYIKHMENLLANPFSFAEGGIADVFESYKRVVAQMTLLFQKRDAKKVAQWQPYIEIVFNIAGALLTYKLMPAGPIFELAGSISDTVGRGAAEIVGKLIIRGLKGKQQANMTNSIDFMKCRIYDVQKQWTEIQKMCGVQGEQKTNDQDAPTMNYQNIDY